ncbi:hypothetical protein [Streptomyces sp. NPDC018045]|uniref:hypothetical protein n=1 Tax=Streptomyces sp. NPDC018045 TaxID=3365037 RepID=UPI0037922327
MRSVQSAQQGGRWPTLPDWMRRCPTCQQHYGVYRVADTTTHLTQGPQRQTRVSTHIVADHPDQVPDYVPGCQRCDEHRATPGHLRTAATATRAAVHRAAHIFAPPDHTRLT